MTSHAGSLELLPSGQAEARVLLPRESRLAMPDQNLRSGRASGRVPAMLSAKLLRMALFVAAAALTAGFAYELYAVLAFVQVTPLQIVFLVLSTLAFGWVALGSLSAAMGFLPLFAGERADTLVLPRALATPIQRTALLFPVYHEDPARIAGTIEAIAEDLQAAGCASAFDVFVLSDTRGQEAQRSEGAVYEALARNLSTILSVFYRCRPQNTAKKAGNVREWIERFGGAYPFFVILDADSVMSGDLLVRLALAMQEHPKAGLVQTVPRLTGGATLFQRLQQFASAVYGPSVAAGIAMWHGSQGNYWGHNAIIRTAAFAEAAGLPALPGRPPFGGHVQSHDFVEAVLLQRAGWEVHMVPTATGTYEGCPPGLTDLVVRDRRWAQGNLQHLAIVARPGLTSMGRTHLAMGAASYIVSVIWAASLMVGLMLALQGQQLIPSYFQDSKTLFPIWPAIDPGAALRLFLATLAVVMLPKVLGFLLEIKRAIRAWDTWGVPRAMAGVFIETLFSMLLAPILMATQTAAVLGIIAGRDTGWTRQRRDDGRVGFGELITFHWWHTLAGLTAAALCFLVSIDLMAWMAPVLLGLVFSVALNGLTALRAPAALAAVLSTAEDRGPPPILEKAALRTADWAERIASSAFDHPPLSPDRALPKAA